MPSTFSKSYLPHHISISIISSHLCKCAFSYFAFPLSWPPPHLLYPLSWSANSCDTSEIHFYDLVVEIIWVRWSVFVWSPTNFMNTLREWKEPDLLGLKWQSLVAFPLLVLPNQHRNQLASKPQFAAPSFACQLVGPSWCSGCEIDVDSTPIPTPPHSCPPSLPFLFPFP